MTPQQWSNLESVGRPLVGIHEIDQVFWTDLLWENSILGAISFDVVVELLLQSFAFGQNINTPFCVSGRAQDCSLLVRNAVEVVY